MNSLSIKNLSKTYENGMKAIDHLSLEITNGMFGLLGPNGAGKSTLMRTIAALQEPTSGIIEFNGINILENPMFIRENLGYLPQEFGVYPKISAYRLLDHLAILKGIVNKTERHNQILYLLQQTNLLQHKDKAVHSFSGGMRQRFGIAQALLGNPKIIIVDEPTAGLDPEERNRFNNLLSEIGESIIVVLSTHIVEDVRDLCTKMAIISNGSSGNPFAFFFKKQKIETDSGINVISAVNIQHIESLNSAVKRITSIDVQERIPDNVLRLADEVVNIDLTSEDLIARLKEGKIYTADKIQTALTNFFKSEQILQLRELALKEVASQVVRKVESEVPNLHALRHEKLLACISSNDKTAKIVIRKAARLASYYNGIWYVLYVETPKESSTRIALDKQRHLINNFKLAVQLGAEVIKVENSNISNAILTTVEQKQITTVCIGKPHLNLFKVILSTTIFRRLLNKLSLSNVDLVILS